VKRSKSVVGPFPRFLTYHEGANVERTSWLAKLRRDLKMGHQSIVTDYIQGKIAWGLQRNERYKAKKGGL
jgi:hypothetical protein